LCWGLKESIARYIFKKPSFAISAASSGLLQYRKQIAMA